MPRRCAFHCEPSDVPMHRFPNVKKFPEIFKSWVNLVGGQLKSTSDYEYYKEIRVCDIHFTDRDRRGTNRLFKEAIPSLHIPEQFESPVVLEQKQPQTPTCTTSTCTVSTCTTSTCTVSTCTTSTCTVSTCTTSTCTVSTCTTSTCTVSTCTTSNQASVQDVLLEHNYTAASTPRKVYNSRPAFNIVPPLHTKIKQLRSAVSCLLTAAPNITVNATFQPSEPMIISEGYNSEHHSFVSPVSHPVSEPSVSTPSRAWVESVAADTCKTDDKTTQADTRPIPKENNAGYWKQKLTHILHSTEFCGICLSTDELVNTVNDHFEIVVGGTSHSRTLADILDVVFQETEDILSNLQICSSCTQKLLQSYIFIQQTRARSNMLKYHLNDLYNKTCFIRNNVVEDLPQEHSDVSNILISMENYDNLDQFQNNLYTKPAKNIVKRDRRRLKQSYKCLTCNLILPSHKAWRVHEITNHKINKMGKTQLNSVTPHQRILKRMCRICHKVVKNGELFKHLKKYHVDSLCPVCCVAFHSLEDLEAHKREWHYSDVSKCLTCLRSYSEAELQQHQCLFRCNVCTEAPCVHHKYLTCYRLQILNGALRAKCLDCQFVCRTKRAYLEHVNMCHLKFSAESLVKCTE